MEGAGQENPLSQKNPHRHPSGWTDEPFSQLKMRRSEGCGSSRQPCFGKSWAQLLTVSTQDWTFSTVHWNKRQSQIGTGAPISSISLSLCKEFVLKYTAQQHWFSSSVLDTPSILYLLVYEHMGQHWIYCLGKHHHMWGYFSLVRMEYFSENSSSGPVWLFFFSAQSNVVSVFDIVVWFLFAELISHEGSKHKHWILSDSFFLLPLSCLYGGNGQVHFLKFYQIPVKLLRCWISS